MSPALDFRGEQRGHGDICREDENALSRDDEKTSSAWDDH